MRSRVFARALKFSAAGLVLIGASVALAGCSSFGMGGFSDPTVTGSVGPTSGAGNLNQPMPSSLGPSTDVAQGPFIPPENVGGYGGPMSGYRPAAATPGAATAVTSRDLPALPSSASGTTAMSAHQNLASLPSSPGTAVLDAPGGGGGVFMHVIESGESIYTIAKRYHVSVQAILSANGMSSPDKIYVGQAIAIPDRPDLVPSAPTTRELGAPPQPLGTMPARGSDAPETRQASAPVTAVRPDFPVDSSRPRRADLASLENPADTFGTTPVHPVRRPADLATARRQMTATSPRMATAPSETVTQPGQVATQATPAAQAPQARQTSPSQPTTQVASLPKQGGVPAATLQEPALSGADKFRWPVKGSIIVDFAASKGTGINIEAPEGTPVRAVENGTVIYAGSGVEGYGNLILIRHANGYVSAYAHLKSMNVTKGDVVNRGDAIGATGMTGSVNRPQLHFELRKGATPVDPVPLMAG